MKNTLSDLNDHLFAQLERLGEEDISEDKLKSEVRRSNAVAIVAKEVIANAQTAIAAEKLRQKSKQGVVDNEPQLPAYLEHKPK